MQNIDANNPNAITCRTAHISEPTRSRIADLEEALASCVGLLLIPPGQVDDDARRSVTDQAKALISRECTP